MEHSRIAEERKKLGLSQEELANKLKISQKSISKYECGTRRPSYETLVAMSSIFNVSVDYLLGKEISYATTANDNEDKKKGFFFFFFDDTLKKAFTSRLKTVIDNKGFTEDTLAELLSMDKDKLQSYVNGVNEPSLEDLITISQTLEVSIDYLLGKMSIQEDKLLHSFQNLTEDNQDIIIGEIKKYLKEQRYDKSVAADEQTILKRTGTTNLGK